MSISEREDLSAILGHFGPYGGRFVPEALIGALEELEETAKLVQLARPDSLENLSDAQIDELRQVFDAAW